MPEPAPSSPAPPASPGAASPVPAASPASPDVATNATGPASAAPPAGPLGGLKAWIRRRNDRTHERWNALLEDHGARLARTRLLVTVILVHVRYTLGYLAVAFLVSAPIQLRHAALEQIVHSVVLGLACLALMAVLIPLTKVDWARMRLPEFKNLELGLTQWASLATVAFLLLSFVADFVWGENSLVGKLADRHVAWSAFTLMAFSWVRIRFDAWLFRDFYTLHPDDDTLVLFKTRPPSPRPLPSGATASTAPAGPPPASETPPLASAAPPPASPTPLPVGATPPPVGAAAPDAAGPPAPIAAPAPPA